MHDVATIEKAVRLQRASYALLRALADPLDDRMLALGVGVRHGAMTLEDAAYEWMGRNTNLVPASRVAPDERRAFANVFASYLETSFDLVESPGTQRYTHDGCWCPLCSYVGQARHLQPKRVTDADKHRARQRQRDYLRDVARTLAAPASDAVLDALAAESDMREPLAMATYAGELVRRMNGDPTGPEVLALWRRFAWTSTGAPKRGFDLDAAMLVAAQERVASEVRRVSAGRHEPR